MKDYLYFVFMLHLSTGCVVSDEQQTTEITGYAGGSVLLPCSCAQPQSTGNTFTWQFHRDDRWIEVLKDEKHNDRLMLFNERSPTNMSLLISDLRKEDEGYYKCLIQGNISIYIKITVKECHLVNREATSDVTGYSGESVVLLCSCTELLAKPKHIQWMHLIENGYKEIYPTEQIESHKNRVKLLNQTTPGNLSLHISALTTNDRGIYYCTVPFQQTVFFKLHVEELKPPQPHHTPQHVFILVTVLPCLLLLSFLALSTRYAKDEISYSAVVYNETAATHQITGTMIHESSLCQYQH